MKKSTEVTKEEASLISLALFKHLPVIALQQIISFLPLCRNFEKQPTLANRALMLSIGFDKTVNEKDERIVDPVLNKVLHEDYMVDKFLYFIAIEGENNQNQAEAILKELLEQKNYALMNKLISTQKPMRDAAGRHFKSMSAVGYAFWTGDSRMSRMLEKYINVLEEKGYEAKQTLYGECKHIEELGIEFTFKGERIVNSKHFDWQPLIEAYNAYIVAATLLINANDGRGEWSNEAWAPVDVLWFNIGKELAKVPTHVAQEYCSDIPFSPLSKFRAALSAPTLKRTVKFHNWILDRTIESWFIRGLANLNLGGLFSIYKGPEGAPVGCSHAMSAVDWADADLAAITALCEMRTVNDRKQTLENLISLAPRSDFHL
jgi:hypothetical protein